MIGARIFAVLARETTALDVGIKVGIDVGFEIAACGLPGFAVRGWPGAYASMQGRSS